MIDPCSQNVILTKQIQIKSGSPGLRYAVPEGDKVKKYLELIILI